MKKYKEKELYIFTALVLIILMLCSCSADQNKNDFSEPETSVAAVSETDLFQAVNNSPTETIVTATAGFETEAASPTEYEFRWTGSDPYDRYDSTGFVSVADVIPDAVIDMRYCSTYNFVGDIIDGYEEPVALLSEEAAYALKDAAADLRAKGYKLIIYDTYRPQRAVEHFASWASDWNDTRMKNVFYPNVDKSLLFDYGYIAYYSGHSRGSKVDLSLVDIESNEEVDMGGYFDYFDTVSHPDYYGITEEQYNNRMMLRNAMVNNGFYPCDTEWWDFTLVNEPYPNTYFNFPVSSESLFY